MARLERVPEYAADAEIWSGYHRWFRELKPRQRQQGRLTGQWPEGTPEIYAQLYPRTAIEERRGEFLGVNPYPAVAEVLTRTDEDVQRIHWDILDRRAALWGGLLNPSPRTSLSEEEEAEREQFIREFLKEKFDQLFSEVEMPTRQREVLKFRYALFGGQPMAFREIGQRIGRSERTARRDLSKAKALIRANRERFDILFDLDSPDEGTEPYIFYFS